MYLIWSASLNPAWPSDQHVGLSAILGSRLSSRDFFLKILSLLVRAWEEGERMEWGGGGRYSLAEWSARRTCYPRGRSRLLAPLQPQAGLVCFVVQN